MKNNTEIQLKPEFRELSDGRKMRRIFADRVIAQEFGDGIYTNGESYRGEVGVYHDNLGHLGGEVKTELGMKRMINKIRKSI